MTAADPAPDPAAGPPPDPAPRKHVVIAATLEREIRAGRVGFGRQLPGETTLASRFAVSRTTVRQALSQLKGAGLISTRSGRGSYVTWAGQQPDLGGNWAAVLEQRGGHLPAAATADRALAALTGLAIGDGIGMPTQLMSRAQVRAAYGQISGFLPASPDHPLAAGMPAASITDDTEQALLVAQALINDAGHVDAAALARALIEWEADMRARGSLDLLGPSTRRAVAAILAGESVATAGRYGVTNGAAMRVAPVGLVVSPQNLEELVDRVEEASSATHNTGTAIAAAAAVAAAVSAGIDGATPSEATSVAIRAAAIGAGRGFWVAGADVSRRIEWAVSIVDPQNEERSLRDVSELVGMSLASQESVPAAFALIALYPDDPWQGCLAAASLGGDSDTVAAMVGAIGGACHGTSAFPAEAIATIVAVNGLKLDAVVRDLLALR